MSKKLGHLTFTRQMPNFLSQYSSRAEEEGIEGALRSYQEKHGADSDAEDRDDREDEAPVVVDALDAVSSRERNRKSTSLFKGGTSAKDKFAESAHQRVLEEEKRKEEESARGEGEAAEGGKHVFKAESKKRRHDKDAREPAVKAKASKNKAMLSFDADEL